VRPSETNATQAEKEAAEELNEQVPDFLTDRNWPSPLVSDSGNGFHAVYPVDLPCDADSTELIKSFLEVLSGRFNTTDAKVDTAVSDPPRLIKVAGTLAARAVFR
jgi:hypothetical protein